MSSLRLPGALGRAVPELLAQPAEPDPPGPLRRDWFWVAVVVLGAVVEGAVADRAWIGLSLVLLPVAACTLPWRRVRPLPVVCIVFGAMLLAQVAAYAADVTWNGLVVGAVFLAFPYSLFRWASGRSAAIGFAVIAGSAVVEEAAKGTRIGDIVAGIAILSFAAVLGGWVRSARHGRRRDLDRARLREREQLARELHDTVAHHVSAIVIRSQAGRAVAATRPEAALEALDVIESEASRTLAEMRSIVGALRSDGPGDRAPSHGVDDLASLDGGDGLRVVVDRIGDLHDLSPSIDAAVFRLAQEAVTNATRHARHASTVTLSVEGDATGVRFSAVDDGEPVGAVDDDHGYGLVGMRERVALLGGSLTAGPATGRGWRVDAHLPRVAGAQR